jgi:hypothetical protein
MRWTQLRTALHDFLAPSLRDRLAIHQARYRVTREEAGRVWLELDGRELISFDTATYVARRYQIGRDIRSGIGPFASPEGSGYAGYLNADAVARAFLRRTGEYDDYSALRDLEDYLSLSIEDALVSESPLVRALAYADRRVGKRRLRSLQPTESEHSLVRAIYDARVAADRVSGQSTAGL